MTEAQALDIEQISKDISAFTRSALLFSQASPRLIDKYDRHWVAVLDGEVRASAENVDSLFEMMAAENIDARYALVRHIQKNQRTLIL